MIIRSYKSEDYKGVCNLLIKVNMEPPIEESDIKGLCIVAEEKEQIVACIWALYGIATYADIGYFAIHPDFQKTKLGWSLLKIMDGTLKQVGIKRYAFCVEPDNKYFLDLIDKHRKANRVTKLKDLQFYHREIGD